MMVLERARLASGATSIRTDGWVLGLATSADGNLLASGGSDGAARIFDVASGTELSRYLHDGWVHAVRLSADGTVLATAGSDGCCRVFDAEGGAERFRLRSTGAARTLALSGDGSTVATGSADGTVGIQAVTGDRRTWAGSSTSPIRSLALSFDGALLAVGRADGEAQLLDLRSLVVLASVAHVGPVRATALSSTGTQMLSAAADGSAFVVDARDQRCAEVRRDGGTRPVWTTAVSPDLSQLAFAEAGGEVRTWDLASGRDEPVVVDGPPVRALAFVSSESNGSCLAVGDGQGAVRLVGSGDRHGGIDREAACG